MIIKYAVTREDYIQYHTYISWDSPEQKKKKINTYLRQILINLGLIAIIFYTGSFSSRNYYIYLYLGILVFMTIVQIFSARTDIARQAEKIANDDKNAGLFSEKTMEIEEAGLTIKDAVAECRYKWDAFIKKEENKDYYFLFTNAVEAIIIPKRVFKIAEEKNRFEKLLAQRISLEAELGHLVKN